MPKKTVRKYEYQVLKFKGGSSWDSAETLAALNKQGLQGWLLVSRLREFGFGEYGTDSGWWQGLFVREK